jgi:hypothetical protein
VGELFKSRAVAEELVVGMAEVEVEPLDAKPFREQGRGRGAEQDQGLSAQLRDAGQELQKRQQEDF